MATTTRGILIALCAVGAALACTHAPANAGPWADVSLKRIVGDELAGQVERVQDPAERKRLEQKAAERKALQKWLEYREAEKRAEKKAAEKRAELKLEG